MDDIRSLKEQIEKLLLENSALKKENSQLKHKLSIPEPPAILAADPEQVHHLAQTSGLSVASVSMQSPNEEKIALFRALFKGREDIYPVRWENQKGKSGYSPACLHEWDRKYCKKPVIKCGECENRSFAPLDDKVISDHLSGKTTIGIYPMLPDESCYFLACDFDGDSWKEDSCALQKTCREYGIPAALERSRSGNGGHIWTSGLFCPAYGNRRERICRRSWTGTTRTSSSHSEGLSVKSRKRKSPGNRNRFYL